MKIAKLEAKLIESQIGSGFAGWGLEQDLGAF